MTTNHEMSTSFDVRSLTALEVLDSRGRPTLAVRITLGDGSTGSSGVPSGAAAVAAGITTALIKPNQIGTAPRRTRPGPRCRPAGRDGPVPGPRVDRRDRVSGGRPSRNRSAFSAPIGYLWRPYVVYCRKEDRLGTRARRPG